MGIAKLETFNIKKYQNQLRTFLRILSEYPQEGQLSRFLPVYFRANKQMGSGDRRTTNRLLYSYFRIGRLFSQFRIEDRLVIAEYLCSKDVNAFVDALDPELHQSITMPLNEKFGILKNRYSSFNLNEIYPFAHHLSDGIDPDKFIISHLIQPDLFIRLYKKYADTVKVKLEQAGIPFEEVKECCLRLPNGTKLESVFPEDHGARYYEVQDFSSQRTGDFFCPNDWDAWWDCCAASGGKSLLLYEQNNKIKLLVSDLRDSILNNLDLRFRQAGVLKYQRKQLDLTKNPDLYIANYAFDGIVLDIPCTGSGTWGRTPELISQFKEASIIKFQLLQRSIIKNVVKYLKEDKPLVYITCSVFKEENEENVDFIVREYGFRVERMEILKGYLDKADSMFVARLIKK